MLNFEAFLRFVGTSEDDVRKTYTKVTGRSIDRIERIEDRGPMAHPNRYVSGSREFYVYERMLPLYLCVTIWFDADEDITFVRRHERFAKNRSDAIRQEREHNQKRMKEGMGEDSFNFRVLYVRKEVG